MVVLGRVAQSGSWVTCLGVEGGGWTQVRVWNTLRLKRGGGGQEVNENLRVKWRFLGCFKQYICGN